jgi:outer membrane protein
MKYIIAFVCILAVSCMPCVSKAQSTNIAYVDLQKIMLDSDQGKQIKTILTADADRLKKALDTKQDELQKLKDAIEKQGATITPEAKAEKEKQYQAKLKDYQRLYGDYQSELQQKDQEYTQKILKEIDEIIKSIGEKEKYMLILERSQAGILFAAPSADITNKIITLFNAASKEKKPAAAPKK